MKKSYQIEVDCAACAAKMETAIRKLEGVENASVNFLTQKLTLETVEEDQTALLRQVVKACKRVEPDCEVYVK